LRPQAESDEAIRRDLEDQLRRIRPEWRVHEVGRMPHGHSGFTYLVRTSEATAARSLVLRLPPPGARPLGPADVVRQGRIMAALARQGFPVPAVLAASDEQVVDGRPFVLLEHVAGRRVEDAQADIDSRRLASSAVSTLRRLHAIPAAATGLDEEPVGLAGDLARWQVLLDRSGTDLHLPFEALRSALASSFPEPRPPCLVHADYHFGNLLFDADGGVVAVLDWEIAEIGQPLIDLGCLAVAGMSRGGDLVGPVPGPTLALKELAELYGADGAELGWYGAFSCYKYSAVYAYNRMLHRRGKRIDAFNDGLEPLIERLLSQGLTILRGHDRMSSAAGGEGG
jgi:aminoglycoside phosphotransferase (APT) family kinase protein